MTNEQREPGEKTEKTLVRKMQKPRDDRSRQFARCRMAGGSMRLSVAHRIPCGIVDPVADVTLRS
jgi:hypothetical protein